MKLAIYSYCIISLVIQTIIMYDNHIKKHALSADKSFSISNILQKMPIILKKMPIIYVNIVHYIKNNKGALFLITVLTFILRFIIIVVLNKLGIYDHITAGFVLISSF